MIRIAIFLSMQVRREGRLGAGYRSKLNGYFQTLETFVLLITKKIQGNQ